MEILCYMYVFDYKCLKNVDFVFDTKYKYHYDIESKTLDIQENENDIPENFWGENITSLTAIVGNNGAGKSTSLKLLLEELVSGYNKKLWENKVLIVSRNGNDFNYYAPKDSLNNIGLRIEANQGDIKIPLLYYANSTQWDILNDIKSQELYGMCNASDLCFLLTEDIKHYANIDASIISKSFREHLNVYNYAEKNRYYDLFLNNGLVEELDSIGLNIPKYVVFNHNTSGLIFYQNHFSTQKRITPNKYDEGKESVICDTDIYNRIQNKKIKAKALYIHHCLVNHLNNQEHFDNLPAYQYLEKWKEYLYENSNYTDDIYNLFEQIITSSFGDIYQPIKGTIKILRKIDETLSFHEGMVWGTYYTTLNNEQMLLKLKDINEKCIKLGLLTGRVYDTYFTAEDFSAIHFSTGEEYILKLLSRIYYFYINLPQKIVNREVGLLILLDEAELGLHPEWQRRYIDLLTNSFNKLGIAIKRKFQIIITTHSPIILSDIPKICTNYLKKVDNKTTSERVQHKETFATNVFQFTSVH